MGNVVDIDTARAHITHPIKCGGCGFKWVAVYPEGCTAMECKGCGAFVNAYGTPVTKITCADCGTQVTVCPASSTFGDKCLGDTCISYDPSRDAEALLGFKPKPLEH